jgi:chromosome segregation protein
MKLHSLAICGFRGFREKLKIDFASGFTVITGRNGVGKSTICDAIEFVITGKIYKYQVEKSAKETFEDYLWWRGDGAPEAHYVTLEFIGKEGEIFTFTRDRAKGLDVELDVIESLLCQSRTKPSEALHQLCRTTIIRDELIAAYSLDLNETDRFDLVRSALGAIDGSDYSSRAKNVLAASNEAFKEAERAYENTCLRLNGEYTELTKIRDSVLKAGDAMEALKALQKRIPEIPNDIKKAIKIAKQSDKDKRILLRGMGELLDEARIIQELRNSFDTQKEQLSKIQPDIETLKANQKAINDKLIEAHKNLKAERQADDMAAALSSLIQHGEHVGLENGHCPLCRAERSIDEFSAGLDAARTRLHQLGGKVETAKGIVSELTKQLSDSAEKLSKYESGVEKIVAMENKLCGREANHVQMALHNKAGKTILPVLNDPMKLEQALLRERSELIEIERNLLTLETSQASNQIAELESSVAIIRNERDKTAKHMAKCQTAVEIAKSIDHAVKRTAHEIVDERLALISPLLNELYQRLRPHSNWRNIEYRIRGDIKRFLSLMVGEDLNPQFVFSSGQRRAAGIAFLLSVHLSRLWCNWKTIILDDPVQHIDDFRALHLVEVLASLRQNGHQVVCTVEDSALANLLCRRLRSDEENIGIRYDLEFTPSGNIHAVKKMYTASSSAYGFE